MIPVPNCHDSRQRNRLVFLGRVLALGLLVSGPAQAAMDDDVEIGPEGECTGYLLTGHAGGGESFLHKNRDSSSWREGVALLQPEDGHKVVMVQTDTGVRRLGYGLNAVSGINVKGVAGATFAAINDEPRPKDPWNPSAVCSHALQQSETAAEYVEHFSAMVEKHGVIGGLSGAVSPGQGWKVEYAGHHWAVDGPYIDDFLPIANVYTIQSMKEHDTGGWSRFGRLRKAREVLERGLYPNTRGQPWLRSWDLQKAFAFARNEEPLESPISGQPDAFQKAALPGTVVGGSDPRPICDGLPWGRPGRCVSAHIAVPDAKHPAHLSVLWWSLDRPNLAPFLPLFVGVTELPTAIDAKAEFAAADRFNELRLLLHEHTEYLTLVKEVWRKFETRQHRRVADEVRKPVRAHLLGDRTEEAETVLNGFLAKQVEEAMETAQKLITKIEVETAAKLLPVEPGKKGPNVKLD
jgi:hypothetical protein